MMCYIIQKSFSCERAVSFMMLRIRVYIKYLYKLMRHYIL